jgi:hypothetical protein
MSVCRDCCVLSGRGLCDEITRPEESYRLWCVIVCDLEKQTSWMKRPRPTRGLWRRERERERERDTHIERERQSNWNPNPDARQVSGLYISPCLTYDISG